MAAPTESQRTATEKTKVLFITLPNELLSEVTKQLEPSDLLKLRLILPKTYNAMLLSLLQDSMKMVYVELTEESVKNFENICTSSFFRAHVKEVTFVPKSFSARSDRIRTRELYTDFCRYIKFRHIGREIVERSWEWYRQLMQQHTSCIMSHPDDMHRHETDQVVSTRLSVSLSQLPSLTKVSICAAIEAPGLNASSCWYADEYATGRIGNRPHTQSEDDAARLAASVATYKNLLTKGAAVIIKAMCDPAVNVRELKLGGKWPSDSPFYLDNWGTVDRTDMQTVAQKLTHLTVSCDDCDDRGSRGIAECDRWNAFFSAAVNLQTLKLGIGLARDLGMWQDPDQGPSVVEHAMGFGHMPSLQHLEIVGELDELGLIDAILLRRFLHDHQATLRTVQLSAILFTTAGTRTGSLGGTITDFLNTVRDHRTLSHFSMTVYRRDEHGKGECKAGLCTNSGCGSYLLDKDLFIHRSELEKLADDLGVSLQDGSWDFGEYVMREE
ncbi:hypothetical protein LTR36_000532 [Oleoguttula mirabilis]|uniref:F-box domain-containing protein n=1 Tax=Oleoguttula mirabilis TaxID=1507867 RepID=A0AAV9JRC6_9PEZI|nr:hypothetical protein LTR36_000532 [Oleoguttula mirabilis]